MSDSRPQRDPVERLADEFASRYRRGELPAIAEYTAAHPEYAGRIEELFPSIVLLERYRALELADRKVVKTVKSSN